MSLIIRIFALILVMIIGRSADLLDNSEESQLRQRVSINDDWKYLENNTSTIDVVKSASGWSSVDLPHTWNQWDAVDLIPGYRRDASWYKKELQIDKQEGKHYVLYFEGANISTKVYINGEEAGGHIGGYVGFDIDISEFIEDDKLTEVLVRVDNSYNPEVIPSQKSDFFIYGGITRDVWLEILPQNHIASVKVSTANVTLNSAETTVDIDLANAAKCTDCFLDVSLIDKNERVVSKGHIDNPKTTNKIQLEVLEDPELWSPNEPNLYRVIVKLIKAGQEMDLVSDKFGYRFYSFEKNGPFYLNGERLLLRGTHRHEEHAGYGAAMPNELHRKDIRMIKEMGANFLRLGHYPQDPEVYKMCDELGIIVWDELPWCRGGIGNENWQANGKRLLEEQILQNYNHPSIFFWSLGNEIYWLPDFENGDDTKRMNSYLTELNEIAHKLDPSRLTAIRKYYDGADLVDVFSPSIWSGWYAGVYTGYEKSIRESMSKYPSFLHMEYGGSSHVGRHTENPITGSGLLSEDDWEEVSNQVNIKNIAKEGDWTENYIVDLFDWHLSVTETMPEFTGNAQWAFKDFGTPLRPENSIPYMNQKGLVDRDGKPKDAYYVFKSYWASEPMIYIESHTWTHREGPQGKKRELSVFSNCEEVEFMVNGISLGKKNRILGDFPAAGLTWEVLFKEGVNNLKAVGYKSGEVSVTDEMTVNYTYSQAEKAERVVLQSSDLSNGNILVEALMVDKSGQRVLNYEGRMYFSVDGAGRLLKNYGTPTKSQVIEMANGRAAIELEPGSTLAIVEARNQDFKGTYLRIQPRKASVQAIIKVQDIEYKDEEKAKIKSAYKSLKKVSIPKTLTGQNKWFMFEGPVLENDMVAYRFYADYRHRFDIYGKRVRNLVMDTVSWDYHNLMDWGSDILKVGNSLGIGSPGIYYLDSVYTLSDWDKKEIEILDSVEGEVILRTTFFGLNVAGKKFDMQQDWTLKTGDLWAGVKLNVVDGQLPLGMNWVTGVVKHLPSASTGMAENNLYLYTYGEQSFHHQDLGMAVMAGSEYGPRITEDEVTHLMVFEEGADGVSYKFMASWAEGIKGAQSGQEFKEQVKEACLDK